jgi:adenine-specific DNA-methyltransferase
LAEKRIYFGTHPTYQSVPRLKIFPPVYQEIIPPNLIENVGTSRSAAKELSQIFDGVAVFDFPKPVSLIQYLIEPIVQDGDWVLDFFAGSGTTAHAVYECQKQNVDCRVVLVQKSEAIIKDTTIAYCSKNSIEPTILGLCEERLRRMSQPDKPFVFTKMKIGTNTK